MPGTSPDYWMAADDRLTATMLDVIEKRQAQRDAKRSKQTKGRR